MDAILLFSHGSVLCGAERNLLERAARMRARGDARIVEVGFLNYTEPEFLAAVGRCVAQGATRIVVAPYFLVSGKFVVDELPAKIAEARERHPSVDFVTADVIGFHPALADAILASADSARAPHEWRGEAQHAAEHCREHPKCPLYRSEVCRA